MMNLLENGIDITRIAGNTFYFILALIVLDVLTGLLSSAKEKKLNSSINFNGMIKKIGELLSLVFVTLIDAYFQANGKIIKIGIYMCITYEGLSIIENFSRIGIDLKFLTKYFDVTKIGKGEKK
jgi:toxin secretion/phage lysis holin